MTQLYFETPGSRTGVKSFLLSFILLIACISTKAQTTLFTEDFSSSSFSTNGWTFDPSQGNWSVGSNYTPIGATFPNAYFNWSPATTNYSTALVSPVIAGSAYVNMTLDYKLELNNYSSSTLEEFSIEYKKVWETSWTLLTHYDNTAGSFDVAPTGQALIGTDTGDFQIRFTAYGANSYNINGWGLDDILVQGIPATACSGQPTAGTTQSTSTNVCPNGSYTLSLSGATQASALAYQWESSPVGAGTWTPIANATNFTYTTTMTGDMDYHCVVTCTNGGQNDVSSALTVTQALYYSCYCSPLNGTTLQSYSATNYITNVTIPGTTLNSSSTTSGVGDYSQFDPNIAGNTGTLIPGLAYNLDLTVLYPNYDYEAAWIDFDHSGTFDATEFISFSGYNTSATFVVPVTAMSGPTGMRVRSNDYGISFSGTDACTNTYYGETEDYVVDIAVLTPCTGTPDPTTVTGPSSVCANTTFSLTATGMSYGTGISYEWQSFDGTNWNPIVGATNTFYTVTGGITAATDYRMVTTCANGGGQDISNTFTMNLSPFYMCYCTATNQGGSAITNVTIASTTLNNSTGAASPPAYYISYPATGSTTADLAPGLTYVFNVTFDASSIGSVWIDFDQSGTYDASEWTQLTTNGTSASVNVMVPVTALSGQTGMRVRSRNSGNQNGANDACLAMGSGETEDYIVNILPLTPCAGTPDPTTVSGPATACSGIDFTLIATGMTVGLGITYEWQSFDGTNWNPIVGATNTAYTVTGGITAATDYRFVTTCSNGGGQDISNTVTVGIAPYYQCYCSPLNGTTLQSYSSYNYISAVEIPGTTLSSSSTTSGAGDYSQFDPNITGNTATLVPGLSYTLNMTVAYPSYDYEGAWIDYDQSGTFDAGEFISFSGYNTSTTFSVPVTALPGQTGMRVRSNDYGITFSGTDACADMYYGETEDYIVTIAALTACTGTPDPATASGPASVCAGLDFTLSATGMTVGLGISYEWQSFDGTNWNPVVGGTSPTFVVTGGQTAATDYRLITTCSNGGGQDISNTVSVAMNPFYNCYCSPLNGTTLSQYYGTNYITSVAIPATTLNASTSSAGPNGYSQMDPNISSNTASLSAGASYTINVGMYYPTYDIAGAWIDYDQSGTFDAGEEITFTGTSATFLVPSTATQGMTGLRVRVNDWGVTYSGGSACTNDYGGETEDYMITIAPPPTCPQPTTLSSSNVTATSADIAWVEAGTATQWSVEYGPQGFTPGTGTFVSVTGTPSTTITVSPATLYNFFVRSICSASDSSAQSLVGTFTTPCVTANGPYNQSFNTGSTPLCWTNAGPELWLFSTGSGPAYGVAGSTDHTGNGGDFAWVDGSGSGTNQDITLTAVPVDVSAFAAPNLSYYMKSYNADDGALNKLLVQAFDGTDWINIDSVQMNMPSSGWYNRQVLLAPFSLPATVQIRFVVDESNNVNGSSFYNDILLDDVNIVDGPLAVGLGDIAAVNVHTRNRIDWNTINETTGDYFILERSADGRNFSELATVNAKGQPSTYSYWDEQPVSGVNYYRLKMMDAAGKAEYSKVVTATVKGANGFTVEAFPNPVTDVVTVKMYGTMGDHATVSISDITGKVIKMFTVSSNELKVNMGGMAQGIYLIKYADNNHTETLKVNKQ